MVDDPLTSIAGVLGKKTAEKNHANNVWTVGGAKGRNRKGTRQCKEEICNRPKWYQ